MEFLLLQTVSLNSEALLLPENVLTALHCAITIQFSLVAPGESEAGFLSASVAECKGFPDLFRMCVPSQKGPLTYRGWVFISHFGANLGNRGK